VHSKRLESYHLEVMVASMFGAVGSNFRDALKSFFDWAPNRIDVDDPAGHSGRLSTYLTSGDREALRPRFAEALVRAKRALGAELLGDHTESTRLWRVELGDEFPMS